MRHLSRAAAVAFAALASCKPSAKPGADAANELNQRPRLPTGAYLDPVASASPVGSMPLAMILSPDGNQVVVLPNGDLVDAFDLIRNFSNARPGRGLHVALLRSTDRGLTGSRNP